MIMRPAASRHEYSCACASEGVSTQSAAAIRVFRSIFPFELNSLAWIRPPAQGKGPAAFYQALTGSLSVQASRFCTHGLQKRAHHVRRPSNQLVDLRRVLSAGLRKVGASAAAAADDGSEFLDDASGLD